MRPLIKWPGSKNSIRDILRRVIPPFSGKYYEPFGGSISALLELSPRSGAVISDLNPELMNFYKVVLESPEKLFTRVQSFDLDKKTYLALRAWDRDPGLDLIDGVDRAARFIYLNKLGFNGLYRVNQKGYHNVAYGRYKKPLVLDRDHLHRFREWLIAHEVEFRHLGYQEALKEPQPGDFVYLDPPYYGEYNLYTKERFTENDHRELKSFCDSLTDRGVCWLLSNSYSPFISELYGEGNYWFESIYADKKISVKVESRGPSPEFLIGNYNRGLTDV